MAINFGKQFLYKNIFANPRNLNIPKIYFLQNSHFEIAINFGKQ